MLQRAEAVERQRPLGVRVIGAQQANVALFVQRAAVQVAGRGMRSEKREINLSLLKLAA